MNYSQSNQRKMINRFDLAEDSSSESQKSDYEEDKCSPLQDNENLSRNFINRGNFMDSYSNSKRKNFYELSQIKEESQENFYSPDEKKSSYKNGESSSMRKEILQFSVDH